jgi:hypothetical protein
MHLSSCSRGKLQSAQACEEIGMVSLKENGNAPVHDGSSLRGKGGAPSKRTGLPLEQFVCHQQKKAKIQQLTWKEGATKESGEGSSCFKLKNITNNILFLRLI